VGSSIDGADRSRSILMPLLCGRATRCGVSPASPPPREWACHCAKVSKAGSSKSILAEHVFRKWPGSRALDERRLAIQRRIADRSVRALFTAAGERLLARIADRLICGSSSDPKFLVGFSDITILQLSRGSIAGWSGSGSLVPDGQDGETLRKALMTSEGICLHPGG